MLRTPVKFWVREGMTQDSTNQKEIIILNKPFVKLRFNFIHLLGLIVCIYMYEIYKILKLTHATSLINFFSLSYPS